MAGVTKAFCEAAVRVTPESIPQQGFKLASQLILDAIAAGVAGATQPGPQILASYIRDEGGAPKASVIGMGFKTTLLRVALLNGSLMHVLDFEPMANPANHPVSSMLPGLFALAEDRGLDGRDVATALIVGYEAQSRLRVATGKAGTYRFHTPGVVGAIGGAVAAGYALRLTSEQLRHAVGMAASRAGGLHANNGSMTKSTHLGWAAAHGLESALLAERGFQANSNIIEAHRGFADAFIDGEIDDDVISSFGNPYLFVKDRFAIKLSPAPYPTHWGIGAAVKLRDRLPPDDEIISIAIDMPEMKMVDRPRPTSGLEGIFSTQYTVACALTDGKVGIDHLKDATLRRPEISDLLSKTRVSMDPDRPFDGARRWVSVSVTTRSGQVLTERCDKPEGHFDRPPLSLQQHRVKLDDCLSRSFDQSERDYIIDKGSQFEKLTAAEVLHLIQLLGRPILSSELQNTEASESAPFA